jgi:hypothetical protein
VLLRRGGVECLELGGGETHGDDLHGLSAAAGPATASTLQRVDVVAGLGLVGPLLDLLVTHHANNV